jgi:ZIP family zinc transporter
MVLEAALWGAVAASSLLVGAVISFVFDVPERVVGLIMAFGGGVLFGAVAYELIAQAVEESVNGLDVAIGFAAGALTFYLGSLGLERLTGSAGATEGGGAGRLGSRRARREAGLAIVLGTVLDGLPESVVIGLSVVGGPGLGLPLLASVFLSNVPEAIGATDDLTAGGIRRTQVLGLWTIVVVASGAAAAVGYALLGSAPTAVVVAAQAFAGGAILTMLGESMIPEAHEKGGREVGLATSLGFAMAALLSFAL